MGSKSKKKKNVKQIQPPQDVDIKRSSPVLSYVIVILTVVIVLIVRIRLLNIPLERDEGEFAYIGQLLLQGIPPYLNAYSMKLPGIYAAYAFIMAVFGQTITGIHLGFIIVNVCTIILVFLLVKDIFDPLAGAVACTTFGVLSLSSSVLGTSAHATHFVVLPVIGGLILMLKFLEKGNSVYLFFCGVLLGTAFLMKQHGIVFAVFAGLYLIVHQMRTKPILYAQCVKQHALLIAGVVLPFTLSCLLLLKAGVFDKFWFWTFTYACAYASEMSFSMGLENLFYTAGNIVALSFPLWILAGIGLSAVVWNDKAKRLAVFVVCFFIFSFLAICPGFYFRGHYFVLLLPAVSLLTGVAISSVYLLFQKSKRQWIAVLLFLIAVTYTVYKEKDFFFLLAPHDACRLMYGDNPFPESIEIANYIKSRTAKDDRIAVVGSEPQIYFYSDRLSATGYIYMYGLMEHHKSALNMQREMIREVEARQPKFLIFVDVRTSWLTRPDSEKLIFKWFQEYSARNYKLSGIVQILSPKDTVYLWGGALSMYRPRQVPSIGIFEKLTRASINSPLK